jgi:hypothetical protein
MRKNRNNWRVPLAGALLFTTAVSAETDTYVDGKNKITLSVGVGLNISAKFKGTGGSLTSSGPPANGRTTPHGDPYNYDDGYVLTDSTGNFLGLTSYWGYDNASQYNAAANTFAFHNSTATGIPSEQSGGSNPYLNIELTYNRELFVKEDWHNTSFGLEAAVSYMPISFSSGGTFPVNVTTTTTTYGFGLPAGLEPGPGYPGSIDDYYGTPGSPVLVVPFISQVTGAPTPGTFSAYEHFDGNFFGFRLGPYVEYPFTDKLSLHLSAGLAAGLLYDHASWQETLVSGGGTTSNSGSGNDTDVLWGGYVSLQAQWQLNERWGVEIGGQFQDLGKYDHNFSGREAELDFSRAIFVHAGVSYSF